MIYLENTHKNIVQDILNTYLPNRKVLVFGSRVKGNIKPYSDLDLCIMGIPLSLEKMALLREAFSNSDLPMRVDLVEWNSITPEFQRVITECSVPFNNKS